MAKGPLLSNGNGFFGGSYRFCPKGPVVYVVSGWVRDRFTIVIVSWLKFHLFRGLIQPTYLGVIIHLLSTMDVPVA